MMNNKRALAAIAVVFALVAGACGSGSDDAADTETETTAAPAADDAATDDDAAPAADDAATDDDAMAEGAHAQPGEGVSVTMARADWSTGYFQAYLYQQLLGELGYEVSDPADLELGPSLAYLSMAEGDIDFWANSWYPGHSSWWEPELPDGTKVGDHLEVVGSEMMAGGLQGYLVTKSFAEEFGVTHLDQLNNDPDILAAFDAADPVPGNGKADIYGCPESWTCDNIIQAQIAFSGWDNITQTIAGYDAMIAEAIDKANSDVPMVIYTWTPSAYITELIPGDNVVWLSVEEVIDDSNPNDEEGGEAYSQLPGTAAIDAEFCPGAATDGECRLGWVAADIQVTGNADFLEANPAAKALFEAIQLSVIDVSLANVQQAAGADTNEAIQGLVSDWIASNRELVDGWIATAVAAG